MSYKARRLVVSCLAVLAALTLCFVWLASLAPVTAQPPTPDRAVDPELNAQTSSDLALKRMTAATRDVARGGGNHLVFVRIETGRDLDLSRIAARSMLVGVRPLGEKIYIAETAASALTKVASLPGVQRVAVLDMTAALAAPDIDPDRAARPSVAERRERIKQLRSMDQGWNAPTPNQTMRSNDWYDVRTGHASQAAWTKGYQGQGVKVAVLDSGADMGHPDLLNTWVTVSDELSPHYGWPMAFDPFSMYLYVLDANFAQTNIATGAAWYADTRTQPATYRNAGDEAAGVIRLKFSPFRHSAGRGGKRPGDEHEYILPAKSQSGNYHIGNHPDRVLSETYGQHVAVLLVDEKTANVYDTVYVDLDGDFDFTDEKPVTRESPASYRDIDGDGLADLSGGMVYFIADGRARIPAIDALYVPVAVPPPANGALVAFMGDYDPEVDFHGTLCSSAVVGQGHTNGLVPTYSDLSPSDQPVSADLGMAPKAWLVPVGNIYFNFEVSTQDGYALNLLGYDGEPETADDIQILSNSYGSSTINNDGWDYMSRWLDRYVRGLNPSVAYIDSTGNGAPGYGTDTPNGPEVGIAVGASTMYGTTGWDSITRTTQIVFGETTSFSNRGPTARGTVGVDVVANGDRGAGALQLNVEGNGRTAWETWGGTSRSTPIAAGNLALVYQAFKAKHNRWPTYLEARAILKAGAVSTGSDVLTQGSGMVNADYATDIASGRQGIMALPDEWRAGGYRGATYPAFASIINAGQSDTQVFSLTNPSSAAVEVNLSARGLRRFDSRTVPFTTSPVASESPYNFNTPDYLIPVQNIPPGTDLMMVSVNFPLSQLDGERNYVQNQAWRLLLYDWTDINGDGRLWTDTDGDGAVDHADISPAQSSNIDDFNDLDWSRSEVQRWEYVRVMYNNSINNTLRVQMHSPLERMSDGLFIGLQHQTRSQSAQYNRTQMTITLDFFRYEDWPWVTFNQNSLTIEAGATSTATATISIPQDAILGVHQGEIRATYAARAPYTVYLPHISAGFDPRATTAKATAPHQSSGFGDRAATIPIIANVAAEYDFNTVTTFGGAAANDPNAPYNNGAVYGYFNWNWRAESGDWRFFFFDVPEAPPAGTAFVVRNVWAGTGSTSDIDSILLGPTSDRWSDPSHPDNSDLNLAQPSFYGPYTLDTIGASVNRNTGAGVWRFQTATGRPDEWVAGGAREGLHALLLHNVLHPGLPVAMPYTTTVGVVTTNPSSFDITAAVTAGDVVSGCVPFTFRSNLDLPGLTAEAFGLSRPDDISGTVNQDDPNAPATSSFKRTYTVTHAATLNIELDGGSGPDLDLYLVHDANNNGIFTEAEIVASSTTATAQESIALRAPIDGSYQVWVHGWSVTGGPVPFDMVVDIVQGNDLSITGVPAGPIPANTLVNLEMCYERTMQPGEELTGQVLMGPTVAPNVLSLPVTVRRAP